MSFSLLLNLAFDNFINSVYSVTLLLLVILFVILIRPFTGLIAQWTSSWNDFKLHCHRQLDSLLTEKTSTPLEQLRQKDFSDLAAYIETQGTVPSPEECSRLMLISAQEDHHFHTPFLFRPQTWEKLPGLAILFGLLGTFVGLTFALTQLPFREGLAKLELSLQNIFPLMGVAFWTSVCGLIASFIFRIMYHATSKFQEHQNEASSLLYDVITRRCLRELYPYLAKHQILIPPAEHLFQTNIISLTTQIYKAQTESIAFFKEKFNSFQFLIDTVPQYLSPIQAQLEHTNIALQQWSHQLDKTSTNLVNIDSTIENMKNILHQTLQVLQHQYDNIINLQQSIESIIKNMLKKESELPEKFIAILRYILRPIYETNQRSYQELKIYTETLFQHRSSEWKTWSEELHKFSDKLSKFDALIQNSMIGIDTLRDIKIFIESQHLFSRTENTLGNDSQYHSHFASNEPKTTSYFPTDFDSIFNDHQIQQIIENKMPNK